MFLPRTFASPSHSPISCCSKQASSRAYSSSSSSSSRQNSSVQKNHNNARDSCCCRLPRRGVRRKQPAHKQHLPMSLLSRSILMAASHAWPQQQLLAVTAAAAAAVVPSLSAPTAGGGAGASGGGGGGGGISSVMAAHLMLPLQQQQRRHHHHDHHHEDGDGGGAPHHHHPQGDRIIMRGLVFHGHHGALPEETALGQKFVVDAELWADLSPAGASDDLNDTVDYAAAYGTIRAVVEGRPRALQEAVAAELCERLLGLDARVRAVRVHLRKPHVALPGVLESVGVELLRWRRQQRQQQQQQQG